ncbi:hypothetical protein [Neisseria sp. P0022.S006]
MLPDPPTTHTSTTPTTTPQKTPYTETHITPKNEHPKLDTQPTTITP